ncbi:MAG: hypothetical protein U0271_38820 [Polyangiaceae bacterium]
MRTYPQRVTEDDDQLEERVADEALAAWDTSRFDRLTELAGALGAVLDARAVAELDTKLRALKKSLRKPALEGRRLVVEALVAARRTGVGWRASRGASGLVALVVRDGGRVAVDLAVSKVVNHSPSTAWPELAPWRRAEHENRAACDAWARAAGRTLLEVAATGHTANSDASEELALLERVAIDAPDDDDARAVLADALLARGDPRGEFIALGLTIAPHLVPSPARRAIELRRAQLLERAGKSWTPRALTYARSVRYRRGLVEELSISPSALGKHGRALATEAPIRRVKLDRCAPNVLATALSNELFARVEELDLAGHALTVEHLAALARSTLPRLSLLSLGFSLELDVTAVRLLGAAPWASRVVSLAGSVSDEALECVAEDGLFPKLERLELARTGDGALALLAVRDLLALSARSATVRLASLLGTRGGSSLVWLRYEPSSVHVPFARGPLEDMSELGAPPETLRALSFATINGLYPDDYLELARQPAFSRLRYFCAPSAFEPLDEKHALALLEHPTLAHVVLGETQRQMLSKATIDRMERITNFTQSWPLEDAFDAAFVARRADLLAASALEREVSLPTARPRNQARAGTTRLEQARSEATAPEVLVALAESGELDILAALVENPSAPAAALDAFLASASFEKKEEILGGERSTLPKKRGGSRATSGSPPPSATLLAAAAAHSNASPALLTALASSGSRRVRDAVAAHPSAPAEALRVVRERGASSAALAQNPNLPADEVLALVSEGEAIQLALASRRDLDERVRSALLASTPAVVERLVEVGALSSAELARALERASPASSLHRAIVAHPDCPAIELERVAHDPESTTSMHAALARNPRAPESVLRAAFAALSAANTRLMSVVDIHPFHAHDVAQGFASITRHPKLPVDLLEALARESPQLALANPSTPESLVASLLEREPSLFGLAVAHPNCPRAALGAARAHEDPSLRAAAATNPSLEPAELAALAEDSDEHVRAGVAANRGAAASLLEALSSDAAPRVWLALAENPATPAGALRALAERASALDNKPLQMALAQRGSRGTWTA